MVSFKHILITFTILSVSIWFTHVTSELTIKQQSCVDTITNYTHYKNDKDDYDLRDYKNNPTTYTDSILTLAAGCKRITTQRQGQPQDAFITLMDLSEVDQTIYSLPTQKADIIIGLREQYTDYLGTTFANQQVKPVNKFCETNIKNDNNTFIEAIVKNATENQISKYYSIHSV